MTSLATVAAGSVGAVITNANSAQSIDVNDDSVHTAKVTVIDLRNVSSRDLPSQHHANAPPKRHSHTLLPHQAGVVSAYVTTRDTRRWTAPPV